MIVMSISDGVIGHPRKVSMIHGAKPTRIHSDSLNGQGLGLLLMQELPTAEANLRDQDGP